MYETFDHTADVGLRVRAGDLETLLREAAEGLFSLIIEDLRVDATSRRRFEILGNRPDYLLFDWLNELLYVFDTEHLVFGGFELTIDDAGLTAAASFEPLDARPRLLLREVKAVTYHGLRCERTSAGWLAEVILDI